MWSWPVARRSGPAQPAKDTPTATLRSTYMLPLQMPPHRVRPHNQHPSPVGRDATCCNSCRGHRCCRRCCSRLTHSVREHATHAEDCQSQSAAVRVITSGNEERQHAGHNAGETTVPLGCSLWGKQPETVSLRSVSRENWNSK